MYQKIKHGIKQAFDDFITPKHVKFDEYVTNRLSAAIEIQKDLTQQPHIKIGSESAGEFLQGHIDRVIAKKDYIIEAMKNRQSFDNEGFDNLGFLLSKVRHAIIQVRFKDNIVSASQDPRWETPTN
jgi:hypothetical protein